MVECELLQKYNKGGLRNVLIDTWWNVNISSITFDGECILVLIDTWWNVNVVESKTESEPTGVLIDTWWNVNRQELKRMITLRTCFNRYMVECEYSF